MVESRLGEKRARHLQNFVGAARFLNFLASRSSAFRCLRSALITPSLSLSFRLTQTGNVWLPQPIVGAMYPTAAHSDGHSVPCSRTRRTARSRTSRKD